MDGISVTRMWAAPDFRALTQPSDDEWKSVDIAIREALERIQAQTQLTVVFVLTDGDPEATARIQYVYFEPTVHVVVGIGSVERKISIAADEWLWDDDSLRPVFEQLTETARAVLRERELADALIDIAGRAAELMVEPPTQPSFDSGSDWVDRALDRAIEHYDQPTLGGRLLEKLVPTSLRTILMILGLMLGSVFGVLFALAVIDSWMTPEADRPFEWGAVGHSLCLLIAVLSIAGCVRMAQRFFNELRGRSLPPLWGPITNERIGWVICVVLGVPLAVNLVLNIAETDWSADVPFLVLIPMLVLDWIDNFVFAVLCLLAPRLGRWIDASERE